jgi:hypothetical protein
MLIAKVAVRLHSQRSPILVTQPAGNGRNIHAALDASGCEEMAEVVVGKSLNLESLTRSVDCLLAFGDSQYKFTLPAFRTAWEPRVPHQVAQ